MRCNVGKGAVKVQKKSAVSFQLRQKRGRIGRYSGGFREVKIRCLRGVCHRLQAYQNLSNIAVGELRISAGQRWRTFKNSQATGIEPTALKALHRLIVTSATYRQTSATRGDADADNLLLACPAATPDDVVQKLRAAARKVAMDPNVINIINRAGSPIEYLDAPEFQTYWDADAAEMTKAVRAVGKVE